MEIAALASLTALVTLALVVWMMQKDAARVRFPLARSRSEPSSRATTALAGAVLVYPDMELIRMEAGVDSKTQKPMMSIHVVADRTARRLRDDIIAGRTTCLVVGSARCVVGNATSVDEDEVKITVKNGDDAEWRTPIGFAGSLQRQWPKGSMVMLIGLSQ